MSSGDASTAPPPAASPATSTRSERGKDTDAFRVGDIVYRRGRSDDLARVVAIRGNIVVVQMERSEGKRFGLTVSKLARPKSARGATASTPKKYK